jgi:hypothetical protein
VKVGDLVRFKNQEFFSFYGSGLITGQMGHWSCSVLFREEIVTARKEELEVISEGR